MNKEEFLKAIDEGIKKLQNEPSKEQAAFENGCKYTLNCCQHLIKYCNELEKENRDLKEKVILLKASEPMLEFAKQTYKTNWNELKKWLENQTKELNPRELEIGQFNIQNDDYTMGQYNVYQNILKRMQELEGKSE